MLLVVYCSFVRLFTNELISFICNHGSGMMPYFAYVGREQKPTDAVDSIDDVHKPKVLATFKFPFDTFSSRHIRIPQALKRDLFLIL